MRKNIPFYLFTIAFLLFAISPYLLAEGMFFDGLDYAVIGHNLAQGIGSFWSPKLSETLFSSFYEHPPLAFGLQALFYKCFGNGIYVDKIYSVTTFLITGFIIIGIWKTLGKKIATAWLPLLLWLCFPLVLWALPNNLLENTMSIFVVASLWCYLLYKKYNRWYWLPITGLMIGLAFFTKGVTGLFTLVMPCFYIILHKEKFRNIIKETGLILTGLFVPCFIVFITFPKSYTYIILYLQNQVIDASQNWITVNSRFYIVKQLLLESIPHFIILFITILYNLKSKSKILFETYRIDKQIFWFLITTALCGVLPMMISLKQSSFYMLSALPLFAIGWGWLMEPVWQQLIHRISDKAIRILYIISIMLVLCGIGSIIKFHGTISQDKQLLTDIHQILPYIPENSIISIDNSMLEEWKLYPYFARYKNISLDFDNELDFLLLKDSAMLENFQQKYVLKCRTQTLWLYERHQ